MEVDAPCSRVAEELSTQFFLKTHRSLLKKHEKSAGQRLKSCWTGAVWRRAQASEYAGMRRAAKATRRRNGK
jgi:hypothetical protein